MKNHKILRGAEQPAIPGRDAPALGESMTVHTRFASVVLLVVFISLLVPMLGSVALNAWAPEWRWDDVSVHSTVEATGAIIGLALAGVLLARRRHKSDTEYHLWLSSGLLGMGILDLSHSVVSPGLTFVWFHSMAVIVGGLFFALVWLPGRIAASPRVRLLPQLTIIATIGICVFSICLPDALPAMLTPGGFTPTAQALNILGGIGFFSAAIWFLLRLRTNKSWDDSLFAYLCVLLGAAGVLFRLSLLWDAGWWWWHLLRLAAFCLALYYSAISYQRTSEQLQREITDRRQGEAALRESETKYRLLAENAMDVIWTRDMNLRLTYISPSVERQRGFTVEEVMEQSLNQSMTPASAERIERVFQEEFTNEISGTGDPSRSRTLELEMIRRDGSTVWIESTTSFLRDKAGQAIGILGINRNITERKLEEGNKARLEEQLRQAQKMESIGTLAGGIAHDFNNILGIIVGNTELVMNDVPEGNQAHHNLEEVIKASLRARDMVKQILAFSRQTEEQQTPVRIGSIIEESLKLLRSATPTTIEIREDFSIRTDTVLGDPTKISQILMNLCSNATHAMRDRGGVLEVSLNNTELDENDSALHQDLTAGKYVVLTVSDTGQGMEPEIVERMFDPYFTTKGVGEGSGMGLSVVHGIVKDHGGAVRVESKPGKGSSFEVFLPVLVRDVEPSSEPFATLPTGSEHILFVDDEQALADLGKRMLQHLGYQVTVRTSSIEALEAFKAQPDKYDLLVTDMTMPNMTGKDLSRELLRIRPGFPIILCTGFSEMITEDSAKQMGIKAFVMKPLVMREIAETVRRIFDQ